LLRIVNEMDLFVVHLMDNGKHHDTRSPTEVDPSIEISGKRISYFFQPLERFPM
jgi:hypothetical protein